MRKIFLFFVLSYSLLLAGFNQQSSVDDDKFEEFKQMMERYNKEYSPRMRLAELLNRTCCVVEYTVKIKQSRYQGIGSRNFGRTSIVENRRQILGTMLKGGLVIVDGGLYQKPMSGSTVGYMSSNGIVVSRPYDIRVKMFITGREYKAEFFGLNEEVGLALLKVNDKDAELPGYLDIGSMAMEREELKHYQQFRELITVRVHWTSEERRIPFIFVQSTSFIGFDEIGGRKYARSVDSSLGHGTPVFDGATLKLLGFAASVTRKIKRQKVTEGIQDQSGQGGIIDFFGGDSHGFGPYIILADEIAKAVSDIDSFKETTKGWTGITEFQPLDADTSRLMGLIDEDEEEVYGIIAVEVVEDSPAFDAGIRGGDIITHWDGQKVVAANKEQVADFNILANRYLPGAEIQIKYRKYNGEKVGPERVTKLTIVEAPKTMLQAETYFNEAFGVMFTEITQDRISGSAYLNKRHLGKVLIKDAESGGWFEVGGVHQNDVVLKINGRDINSIADVKEEMERISVEQPDEVNMLVERAAETMFVNITPDWSRMGIK